MDTRFIPREKPPIWHWGYGANEKMWFTGSRWLLWKGTITLSKSGRKPSMLSSWHISILYNYPRLLSIYSDDLLQPPGWEAFSPHLYIPIKTSQRTFQRRRENSQDRESLKVLRQCVAFTSKHLPKMVEALSTKTNWMLKRPLRMSPRHWKEMVQSVKCRLCQHADLSPVARIQVKISGTDSQHRR